MIDKQTSLCVGLYFYKHDYMQKELSQAIQIFWFCNLQQVIIQAFLANSRQFSH